MTLNKSINVSGPRFCLLWYGDNTTDLGDLLGRLNAVIFVKHIDQCLVYWKPLETGSYCYLLWILNLPWLWEHFTVDLFPPWNSPGLPFLVNIVNIQQKGRGLSMIPRLFCSLFFKSKLKISKLWVSSLRPQSALPRIQAQGQISLLCVRSVYNVAQFKL